MRRGVGVAGEGESVRPLAHRSGQQGTFNAGIVFSDHPQLCPLLHPYTFGVTDPTARFPPGVVRELSDASENWCARLTGARTSDEGAPLSR